jgi:NADH:ubiquinone oxidoreductase subunit E
MPEDTPPQERSEHSGRRSEDAAGALDPSLLAAAAEAVGALPRAREQLLPAFHAAHEAIGWLPRPAIELVAAHTRIPVSEVYATATAYSELRLEPPLPGEWRICSGVACVLAGARALHVGQPDRTALTDCQFLCALAPVAVDPQEVLHGRMTAGVLGELLEDKPV